MANEDEFFSGLDDAEDVTAANGGTADPAAAADSAAADPGKTAEPAKAAAPEPGKAAEPAKAPAAADPARPPAADVEPDRSKWVPVGAHIEQRRQLDATAERLRALEQEIASLKNPPKPKPEAPDYEQDPRGYVDHKVNAALEALESGQKQVTETVQATAAQTAEMQFRNTLANVEQQFAAQTPDYYDAVAHLREARVAELTMLNPGLTEQQAAALAVREEIQLAAGLMRAGKNPSEVAYAFAKRRGYAPKAPPAPGNGAAPNAGQPPANVTKLLPPVPKVQQSPPDLTLGSGSGAADMEFDENSSQKDPFDQAWEEVFPGARRRA